MYKVINVTDRSGHPTTGVGRKAIGLRVLNVKTPESLMEARVLLIGNEDDPRMIATSGVQEVHVQTALFGPEVTEVYTRNSIYYLETDTESVTA